jgi:hypothetical protein
MTALVDFLKTQSVNVTIYDKPHELFDGQIDLSSYSCILHLFGDDFSQDMAVSGQRALVQFVKDGGTYVASQWLGFMFAQEGLLKEMPDLVLMSVTNGASSAATFTATAGASGDPLLAGVTFEEIRAGISAGTPNAFATGPVRVLAQDGKGTPMVMARDFGSGHVVNFGFTASYGGQETLKFQSVQQLILNAINM